MGGELGGHCLGLLGFGRIGRRTAELARAFNMSVLAHDRSPDHDNGHRHNCVHVERPSGDR